MAFDQQEFDEIVPLRNSLQVPSGQGLLLAIAWNVILIDSL